MNHLLKYRTKLAASILLLSLVSLTHAAPGGGVVDVEVDFSRSLRIGSTDQLRRETYFNVHGTPRELTQDELKHFRDELGVSFGRGLGSIATTLRRLGEDPSRPGYANTRGLEYEPNLRRLQTGRTAEGLVESAHPHAYFRRDSHAGDRDRFVPRTPEAVAEFLSAYFQSPRGRRTAYFEPANEINVHLGELGVTWDEACELHRAIAQRLHRDVPGLKVGGPAAAYPAFEQKDFSLWRKHMGRFIEQVGSDLDFLSVHMYTTHWDDKVNYRFGSNTDAILDLMENQSLLDTGRVLPLLISECGTGFRKGEQIHDRYSPERDWLVIRGANHMMFSMLRRDNRMIKMIPFMVLKAQWYDGPAAYPWVLFHKTDDGWTYTHLVKWYEMWKDLRGTHVPASASSLDVEVYAARDGRHGYLCLGSLSNHDIVVEVGQIGGEGKPEWIRRLHFDGQAPCLEQRAPTEEEWPRLTLRPDEAVLVHFMLPDEGVSETAVVESTHYGDKTLLPITDHEAELSIAIPQRELPDISATLRLGVGRDRALSLNPKVTINGYELEAPSDERGSGATILDEYFGVREFEIPVAELRRENRVLVSFPESGGHLSSAVLVTRRLQKAGKAAAISAIGIGKGTGGTSNTAEPAHLLE